MKSNRNKHIATGLLTILSLSLLGYTGYRTVDLISKTLAPNQWALGIFALAALDGGLLLWLVYYQYGARGAWQRAISLIMVGVDLIGVVVAFTTDTLANASASGLTQKLDPSTAQTAIVIMSIVIAANISAVIIAHLLDPDAQARDAEQDALDEVTTLTIRNQRQKARDLAADVAPQLAEHWRQMTRARLLQDVPVGEGLVPAPSAAKTETQAQADARESGRDGDPVSAGTVPAPKAYTNGKVRVNADVPAVPATTLADWEATPLDPK